MKIAFLGFIPFSDGGDVGEFHGDGDGGDSGGDGGDNGDGGSGLVGHLSRPISRQIPFRSSQAQDEYPRWSENSAQKYDARGIRP